MSTPAAQIGGLEASGLASDVPKKASRELLSIQYLRGIAAMMVVFHHARNPQSWLFDPLANFGAGASGVYVFFVISGFIMFTASRTAGVGTFIWNRCTRVIPLYWLATLAVLGLAVAHTHSFPSRETDRHVLESLLFWPHWSPSFPTKIWPYLVPGWSLNYEMFFYGLFAIGLAFRQIVPFVTAAILLCVGAGLVLHPTSAAGITYTSTQLLQFLAGVWIGVAFAKFRFRGLAFLMPLGFVALLLLGNELSAFVIQGAAASAIVIGALALDPRVPQWRMPKLLGDASYSIYLVHPIVIAATAEVIRRLPVSGWPQFALMLFTSILASAAVGIVVRQRIEEPMLRWMKRSRPRRTAAPAGPGDRGAPSAPRDAAVDEGAVAE